MGWLLFIGINGVLAATLIIVGVFVQEHLDR